MLSTVAAVSVPFALTHLYLVLSLKYINFINKKRQKNSSESSLGTLEIIAAYCYRKQLLESFSLLHISPNALDEILPRVERGLCKQSVKVFTTKLNNAYLRRENLRGEYFSDACNCEGIRNETIDKTFVMKSVTSAFVTISINNEYLHGETSDVVKPMTRSCIRFLISIYCLCCEDVKSFKRSHRITMGDLASKFLPLVDM
uniref:Uncharacterized protein n=1 Tax=Glossina palpalis gambiensis TaxID=67801 RepID=A0A1B0BV96_9MUSC